LLVAFLVSKSCGSNEPDVSSREAITIAKEHIDFAPSGVQVKNVPRTLNQQRVWAVSLYTGTAVAPQLCRLVEIDADSGEILATHRC
jgi:hypothetical protein